MTIFLFANVTTAGIGLASTLDLHSRRVKFILSMALAVGVGVTVWPFAFADMRGSSYTAHFWECANCNQTLKGVRNGVSIFLSTGFCIGTVVAMLLNAIIPTDAGVAYRKDREEGKKDISQKTADPSVSIIGEPETAAAITGAEDDDEEVAAAEPKDADA